MLAPLAMASASRPWPQASWNNVPPKPLAMTTGMAPTGAGRESSMVSAFLAALVATARHDLRRKARTRAVVVHEVAERVRDEDPLARVAVPHDSLRDLSAGGSRRLS